MASERGGGRHRAVVPGVAVISAATAVTACCVLPALAGGVSLGTVAAVLVGEGARSVLVAVAAAGLVLGAAGLALVSRLDTAAGWLRGLSWALLGSAGAAGAISLWGDCLVACLR